MIVAIGETASVCHKFKTFRRTGERSGSGTEPKTAGRDSGSLERVKGIEPSSSLGSARNGLTERFSDDILLNENAVVSML
jgi:hypothetical protein